MRKPIKDDEGSIRHILVHQILEEVEPLMRGSGSIYFLECAATQSVKIGYSVNVRQRLYRLQTASAHQLRLLLTIPGDLHTEKVLHDMLGDYSRSGEWFQMNASVRRLIDELRKLVNPINNPEIEERDRKSREHIQRLGQRLHEWSQQKRCAQSVPSAEFYHGLPR
jgi:hypothetical protein